jgi:hypothetical protein
MTGICANLARTELYVRTVRAHAPLKYCKTVCSLWFLIFVCCVAGNMPRQSSILSSSCQAAALPCVPRVGVAKSSSGRASKILIIPLLIPLLVSCACRGVCESTPVLHTLMHDHHTHHTHATAVPIEISVNACIIILRGLNRKEP